jgi:cytochrome c peroxidase
VCSSSGSGPTGAFGDANHAGQSRATGHRQTASHPRSGSIGQRKSLDQLGLPAELTRQAIPADDPQTPEKIALGERLFFDGRLSADGTIACSTCHDPARAFTDGKPTSIGINGGVGQRNAPTILNALYNKTQFWDGRAKMLEDQAALPIVNPIEMGRPNIDAAVARIAAIEEYQQVFQRVFGRSPNGPDLVRAIASYERTQFSFDSPFDHFITGDNNAIDDSAKRGWELFNTKARCNKCHALSEEKRDVTTFTDNDFHNIGIGIIRHNVVALARQAEQLINSGHAEAIDRAAVSTDFSALGRYLITKKETAIAAFKTPDIRNILVTGPYFHDGSMETLWDVIDHYNKGDGLQDRYLDKDMRPAPRLDRTRDRRSRRLPRLADERAI